MEEAKADRHEQEHEQEQNKHAQDKHEQELSPSGRHASVEAELAGHVTILAHAELLGQAERGRNQREAPRSAGRCTVGDSDGPRCNR